MVEHLLHFRLELLGEEGGASALHVHQDGVGLAGTDGLGHDLLVADVRRGAVEGELREEDLHRSSARCRPAAPWPAGTTRCRCLTRPPCLIIIDHN